MESLDRLSRRFLALASAALASLAIVPALASAAPVEARSANSFIESIGVNTHTYFSDTAYHDFPLVEQRLEELGVHHIREELVPERPDQYEHLNELASAGIRSTLILGDPTNGISGLNKLVGIAGSQLTGSVDAVEGPNELDLSGGPSWMPELAAYQSALYSAVKANPGTSALPVIGPALGNTRSVASDISGSMDYGNIHSYPNGEEPETNLPRMLAFASQMSGSKAVIATESGYHTALASVGEQQPVSEAAEATYMPRLFLEYFRRGVARTFAYELLDEFPDPGNSDAEKNFGLLRNDFSPKPAFTALANLTSILADPEPSARTGTLNYTVSGDATDLHQVLLRKSDGSYYLALWRAESVWNIDTRSVVPAWSAPIRLDFASPIQAAQEYVPNLSSQPQRALPVEGGSVSVDVGPQVVIVKLDGGRAEQGGRIRAWVSKNAVPSGSSFAVQGKLPAPASGSTATITIQRWTGEWRTVAHTKSSGSGLFEKTLRLRARSRDQPFRFRVVSNRAKPSPPVRVRVVRQTGGPVIAVGQRRSL